GRGAACPAGDRRVDPVLGGETGVTGQGVATAGGLDHGMDPRDIGTAGVLGAWRGVAPLPLDRPAGAQLEQHPVINGASGRGRGCDLAADDIATVGGLLDGVAAIVVTGA